MTSLRCRADARKPGCSTSWPGGRRHSTVGQGNFTSAKWRADSQASSDSSFQSLFAFVAIGPSAWIRAQLCAGRFSADAPTIQRRPNPFRPVGQRARQFGTTDTRCSPTNLRLDRCNPVAPLGSNLCVWRVSVLRITIKSASLHNGPAVELDFFLLTILEQPRQEGRRPVPLPSAGNPRCR